MAVEPHDALRERLQQLIGTPIASAGRSVNEVNRPMIAHWVDAFCDFNPLYQDEAFARSTRHGDIIAPPAMMPVWTMPRPKLDAESVRGGYTTEVETHGPLALLDEGGYIGNVMTNSEMEFERELRLGDQVNSNAHLESVSARKKTSLGPGYFISFVATFTNQHGNLVGRQRSTLFKFNPVSTVEPTESAAGAAP